LASESERLIAEVANDMSRPTSRCSVSLRQNGVGTGFTRADAILPKGHANLFNLRWAYKVLLRQTNAPHEVLKARVTA
jgi:hypothetical protein